MSTTSEVESAVVDPFTRLENKIEAATKSDLKEKLLIAFLPIVVALVSMWLTHKSASQQLLLASEQLKTTQNIETAKLIAQYSEMILIGNEKEARLAHIAFASVPMTDSQRKDISALLDKSSDSRDTGAFVGIAEDERLQELLQGIFSESENERISDYATAREYIAGNISEQTIDSVFHFIRKNEFNINGRSNVLSILASIPSAELSVISEKLEPHLNSILELEGGNPAHAIGPKTTGWIEEIKRKIK